MVHYYASKKTTLLTTDMFKLTCPKWQDDFFNILESFWSIKSIILIVDETSKVMISIVIKEDGVMLSKEKMEKMCYNYNIKFYKAQEVSPSHVKLKKRVFNLVPQKLSNILNEWLEKLITLEELRLVTTSMAKRVYGSFFASLWTFCKVYFIEMQQMQCKIINSTKIFMDYNFQLE